MTILLALIFIASETQPSRQRLFPGLVFAGFAVLSDSLLASAEGYLYHMPSSIAALSIIILISFIQPITKLAVNLQKICLASIVLNFFGWVMWMLYMPPVMYNSLFIALYVCALLTLITRNKSDVGEHALDSGDLGIRSNYNPSILGRIKHDHPAQQ